MSEFDDLEEIDIKPRRRITPARRQAMLAKLTAAREHVNTEPKWRKELRALRAYKTKQENKR